MDQIGSAKKHKFKGQLQLNQPVAELPVIVDTFYKELNINTPNTKKSNNTPSSAKSPHSASS